MPFEAVFSGNVQPLIAEMDKLGQKVKKTAAEVSQPSLFSGLQTRFEGIKGAFSNVGQSLASGNIMGAIGGTSAAMSSLGPVLGGVAAGAAVVGVAAMGMWSAMSKTNDQPRDAIRHHPG